MHPPETLPRTGRIAALNGIVVKNISDQSQLYGTAWLIISLNLVLLGLDVIGHLHLSF
jgi:hypothetical protein